MIQELKEAIDFADYKKNQKAKEILLEIAKAPEEKQKALLAITRILLNPNNAGKILDEYSKENPDTSIQNKEIKHV